MNQPNKYKASIEKINDLSIVRLRWQDLEADNSGSFFITWSWIGPWAKMVINQTDLYLYQLMDDKTIVAMCFVTLCKVKRMKGLIPTVQAQINEFQANKCNMIIQYNDILTKSGYELDAWKYLVKTLQDWNKHWDEIVASSLVKNKLNMAASADSDLKLIIDKSHEIWKLPLNAEMSSTDKIIACFSTSSRRKIRQSLKAYKKEYGEISLSCAENIEQALDYFKELGRLHTTRWVKAGKSGSFANEKWVSFHTDIIIKGFTQGHIQLIKYHVGPTVLGYTYSLSNQKTAYLIQTGFAATHNNKLRSGYISHLYAIQFYARNNYNYYDLLPDEKNSYKNFFTKPGESVYWIQLQRPRIKFRIEKILRLSITFARRLKNLKLFKQAVLPG